MENGLKTLRERVCHISTVHSKSDDRIFLKECLSLKQAGYDVYLVIQDDKDECIQGVKIKALPSFKNRIIRIMKSKRNAFRQAISVDADLYHIHDPELIPVGIRLKKLGKKVIYDVHEDVPRQIINKDYIPKNLRKIVSVCYELYEDHESKAFDQVVCATPILRDRFLKKGSKAIDICNYPILADICEALDSSKKKERTFCYVGGITKNRGIEEMLKAIWDEKRYRLIIAGNFDSEEEKIRIMSMKEWQNVEYEGYVNRQQIKKIFASSIAGFVVLHPIQNYLDSLPIKMFEYMAAGIPVIASNFPLWRDIIEEYSCGICVDPSDIAAIKRAVEFLINNPEKAKMMGENGKRAVIEKFNWENERIKLINIYESLLK